MKTIIFFIVVFAFIYLLFISVCLRLFLKHPLKSIFHSLKDVLFYFYHKHFNYAKYVGIVCYCGLFGSGKTLSLVHDAYDIYVKYNGKRIYDEKDKCWKTQQIVFLSNITLKDLPFIYLQSVEQIIDIAEVGSPDPEVKTIYYVLIDEASMCLNSRRFKQNFENSQWLNTLVCSRHYNIYGILMSSQRFAFVDKLVRECTFKVIDCKKHWRYMTQTYYDAWDYENASQLNLVKPLFRTGFFCLDKYFNLYDTQAVVETLITDSREGYMLTDAEILALRGECEDHDERIQRKSFKFKRALRAKR